MTAKSTSASASAAETREAQREIANGTTAVSPEVSRQQVARSFDWMAAAFRTGEALQQVNLQMSQRAALLHSQAAENARKAGTPIELVQIQSTLLMYEWQEVARYSQEMLLACKRAVGQPSASGEQGPGTATTAMGGMADAALGAAAPIVQAWQQMFTGAVAEATAQKH